MEFLFDGQGPGHGARPVFGTTPATPAKDSALLFKAHSDEAGIMKDHRWYGFGWRPPPGYSGWHHFAVVGFGAQDRYVGSRFGKCMLFVDKRHARDCDVLARDCDEYITSDVAYVGAAAHDGQWAGRIAGVLIVKGHVQVPTAALLQPTGPALSLPRPRLASSTLR